MSSSVQTIIREADLARDTAAMAAFDASFTTDRVYRLETNEFSSRLVVELLDTPLYKKYPLEKIAFDVQHADRVLVAEGAGGLAGFAVLRHTLWNRRALLTHLYVNPENKGRGIGRALLEQALDFARQRSARCLWLETQNINYPAIQFYKRMGFRFCGFDDTLCDPTVVPGETAVYFSFDLEKPARK